GCSAAGRRPGSASRARACPARRTPVARAVVAAGGVVETGCEATGAEALADGVRVATSLGERRARDVVLATGAWSPLLARSLGLGWLRGAMQPGKGYSITYARPSR